VVKTLELYVSCDVCGSTAQLLALARTRVTRALTALERRQYLHQP